MTGDATSETAVYPDQWEADIVLADGGTAHLRPIRPSDGDLLVQFHGRQSPESVYFRFFAPRPRLTDRQVEQLVNVDYRNRMAFVVLEGDELIAVARYEPVAAGDEPQDEAEVAFFVDDAHNGRGLATILLEYLAVAARQMGRRRLTATVLPENRKMLNVFRAVGFETRSRFSDGYIAVTLDIEADDAGSAAIASRARLAEARSVDRFLTPGSVAVVGGSGPGTLGHEIVGHLLDGRFTGSVHPVNLGGVAVHGQPGVSKISDIDQPVDIAVIAVPQPDVDGVLEDCIDAGVGGVVVTSAGYSESGADGLRAERDLVAKSLRNGLRVLGPNCMGVINTAEDVRLNGSLVPALPPAGSIAVSTQSGALGRLVVDGLVQRGLGVSQFVALGNKADVSGNDLLQFWQLDERTRIILMHLESVGNPGRFQRIARSVSSTKPVIALIPAAETEAPATAEPDNDDPWSQAHWPAGATLATRVEQAGVVAVDSFPELLDAAVVLSTQPVPAGSSVLLIGNSGAALRLAAGEVHSLGLRPANLVDGQAAGLARQLPSGARLANPVDLTYQAGPEHYGTVLGQLSAYDQVDAVVAVHVPPLPESADRLLAELDEARQRMAGAGRAVPMIACLPDLGSEISRSDGDIPVFGSIHDGVRALGVAVRYGTRPGVETGIDEHDGQTADSDRDPDSVEDPLVEEPLLDEIVRPGVERLLALAGSMGPANAGAMAHEVTALLRSGGLSPVDRRIVSSEVEAVEAAYSIGYPVVLKAAERGPLARSQYTGVALDLADEAALRSAYQRMTSTLGSAMAQAEVQAMASAGIDAAVSIHRSMEKGTVLTLGRGGAGATPVDSRPVAMLPLDRHQAERLVTESELGPVIGGISGAEGALVDTLVRLAALVDSIPEVVELRLNPVLIGPGGIAVTDVELLMARPPTVSPRVRRLR